MKTKTTEGWEKIRKALHVTPEGEISILPNWGESWKDEWISEGHKKAFDRKIRSLLATQETELRERLAGEVESWLREFDLYIQPKAHVEIRKRLKLIRGEEK